MREADRSHLLKRGVSEIIVESEFLKLLEAETPLRLKMGFDPSAPDLHLGHAVGLRKLRLLQEMGHKVVVIVGDWTAQIGDPSGRSQTRPMLTAEEVNRNAETYLAQFFKVVDRDRTEIRRQTEWYGSFSLAEVIRLTGRFTVAQFLARDDFAKRFRANQPIAITELLYPLLQAYDSVAVEADVEFGGTDQKFNLLVGRDLQEMMGQRPQQIFLVHMLVGTDGVQKMSKSLGNYIGVDDAPDDMYGKVLSLPDYSQPPDVEGTSVSAPTSGPDSARSTIIDYFEWLTDVPDDELARMDEELAGDSVNPMEMKKRLARELVTQFHDAEAARRAEASFERTVQRGEAPEDIDTFQLPSASEIEGMRVSRLLVAANLVASTGEARRLINQGAVQVDGERLTEDGAASTLSAGSIVRVGRRRFLRLAAADEA